MNPEALIFDLDGTLAHTDKEYRYIIVGQILQEFGDLNPDYSPEEIPDKLEEETKNKIDRFWFGTPEAK